MKFVHTITFSVFAKEHDDFAKVEQALRALVPLDFEKEKIKVLVQKAEGFDGIIKIITIQLTKTAHTNATLNALLEKLTPEQKETLNEQTDTRVDEELDYFIRFDKDSWVNDRVLELTDSGNCVHCKFSLAVYPKKREVALNLVHKLLETTNQQERSS